MRERKKLSDYRILLRFKYRNHLDQVRDFENEFESVGILRNYLRWVPQVAYLIGYDNAESKRIESIDVRHSDVRVVLINAGTGEERVFLNASEFGNYLKKYCPEYLFT